MAACLALSTNKVVSHGRGHRRRRGNKNGRIPIAVVAAAAAAIVGATVVCSDLSVLDSVPVRSPLASLPPSLWFELLISRRTRRGGGGGRLRAAARVRLLDNEGAPLSVCRYVIASGNMTNWQ